MGCQALRPSRAITGCWERCCPFQLSRAVVDRGERLLEKIRPRETAVRCGEWKKDAKYVGKGVFMTECDGSRGPMRRSWIDFSDLISLRINN